MAGRSSEKMSEFQEIQDFAVDVDDGKVPLTQENELDDLPTQCSWNPVDWWKEIKSDFTDFSWQMTEKRRVLLRAVFGEGLVTFLFLFIVEATVVNNGRQANPENLVLGCVSTAFCSIALIYSFADVSGAHFNPAVTFATMVTGKVSVRKGAAFIGIQLLAGIIATAALMVVFPKPFDQGYKSIPAAVVVDLDPTARVVNAFFMELILTFILVYVIFATAFDTVDTSNNVKVAAANKDGKGTVDKSVGRYLTIYTTSGNTKAGFAPIAIGFTLGFLGLLGGSVSGGAFNPARVFGPAILTGHWNNHWLYWVADCIGGGLAGWMQSLFAHKAVQHSGAVKTNKAAEHH
ncbi:hypothetical protein HK102_004412 [Quaeritorhiza haematococci]|nr:hypothetical protein HK102_004412 [Quaeritorhiza haematococci]